MPEGTPQGSSHRKWAEAAAKPPVMSVTTREANTNMTLQEGNTRFIHQRSAIAKNTALSCSDRGTRTPAEQVQVDQRPFITVGKNGRPLQQQKKTIYKRPHRKDTVRGTGTVLGSRVTAAPPPPAQLFLSGCSKDVTPDMVSQHVQETCSVTLTKCEAVGKSLTVASFLVVCPDDKKDLLMSPEVWPKHCSIRKYYTPREQSVAGDGSVTVGRQTQHPDNRFSLTNDVRELSTAENNAESGGSNVPQGSSTDTGEHT